MNASQTIPLEELSNALRDVQDVLESNWETMQAEPGPSPVSACGGRYNLLVRFHQDMTEGEVAVVELPILTDRGLELDFSKAPLKIHRVDLDLDYAIKREFQAAMRPEEVIVVVIERLGDVSDQRSLVSMATRRLRELNEAHEALAQ
jgi:hypothetical protein